MLNKEEIRDLAEQNQYIKVFNFFHAEYTDTLKNFLIRHEVSVSENDCLINYIIKTRMFMPAYKKYTFPITSVYDEYSSEEEKLGTLMSSYNEVKEAFSK